MSSTPDKDKDDNDITHTDTWLKYGYYITKKDHLSPPQPPVVHPLRSLYKTISWRVIASLDTFFISWLVTGYFLLASTIASVEVITKMGLYYFHERAWLRVRFRSSFNRH